MRSVVSAATLCVLAMAIACNTSGEARWQYQTYGAATWHAEPSGTIRISASRGTAGLFARVTVPRADHAYRVRIKGNPVDGAASLRVTTEGGAPQWMNAPIGERSILARSGNLELLFYSEAPFTYDLASISIEPHNSAWSLTEYGSVAWNVLPDDHIGLAVDAPPGGLYFAPASATAPMTRVHLQGRRLRGSPLVRVTSQGREPRWLMAPDGELSVSLPSPVEFLLYGDAPFSYEVQGLRFEACPTCLDAAAMQSMLKRDIPGLEPALATDSLRAATLLLDWAANTVDLGWRSAEQGPRLTGLPAPQVYQDYWTADAAGASCGEFATFFRDVLALFSLRSFTVAIGYPGTDLTHVTTVMVLPAGEQPRFFILDPTLNGHYRDRHGNDVDLAALLRDRRAGVSDAFVTSPIKRDVVFAADDRSGLAGALQSVGYNQAACVTRAESRSVGVCKAVPYSVRFLMTSWSHQLRQLGVRDTQDVLLHLLTNRVISIDGANAAEREAFRQLISAHGIPFGTPSS